MLKTRRITRDQWAERIAAWQRSGLSAVTFGARHGWDPAQLRWWRWKLAQDAEPAVSTPPRPTPPTFLRLIPSATTAPTPPPELRPPTWPCELVLRDGRTLRFETTTDPQHLRALADALEGRS